MEYYSAIERNALKSVLMRWMNLEPIIHSEVSQREKNNYHLLTPIYGSWRRKWKPTPVFLPGESQAWRSLVGSMGSHRVRHNWATELNWIRYLSFSFWLTSLCIIGSRFIHLIRTDSNVFFYGWVIFHCVYVPQLLYPLICLWASRLLPCSSCCK